MSKPATILDILEEAGRPLPRAYVLRLAGAANQKDGSGVLSLVTGDDRLIWEEKCGPGGMWMLGLLGRDALDRRDL